MARGLWCRMMHARCRRPNAPYCFYWAQRHNKRVLDPNPLPVGVRVGFAVYALSAVVTVAAFAVAFQDPVDPPLFLMGLMLGMIGALMGTAIVLVSILYNLWRK